MNQTNSTTLRSTWRAVEQTTTIDCLVTRFLTEIASFERSKTPSEVTIKMDVH